MNWSRTVRELTKYKDYVLSQSKRNLTRAGIGNRSRLYKSLRGLVSVKQNRDLRGRFASGDSPQIKFTMNDYGKFVDLGVRGTNDKDSDAYKKPFKYNKLKKMINIGAVESFISRKVRARSSDGRFTSRSAKDKKSLVFAIAKSIHSKGIKRSMFFTKPLNKRFKKTVNDIHKGSADDITLEFVRLLRIQFKDNKR